MGDEKKQWAVRFIINWKLGLFLGSIVPLRVG